MTTQNARGYGHVGDMLSAYLDHELSPMEQAQVENHLAACAACQRELQALQATVQCLRALPPAPLPRSFILTTDMLPARRPSFLLLLLGRSLRVATALVGMALIIALGSNLLITHPPAALPAPPPTVRENIKGIEPTPSPMPRIITPAGEPAPTPTPGDAMHTMSAPTETARGPLGTPAPTLPPAIAATPILPTVVADRPAVPTLPPSMPLLRTSTGDEAFLRLIQIMLAGALVILLLSLLILRRLGA